ncbi:UDP-N-acetylglucosamine 1-carboxyvinyltransferase [Eubacterium coprostanoligenes]|uniref:UDP-N-acetylglucosamine 1-carboxyvinyltransferase n=1 Tax=Eubacterium coprostanoligenes TaxID=290054 RepID=A0A1T4KDV0_9FIRM|nr:UDP-N-acetylglucosamine 1-carboxyvinyltransferase [Eubacterium coprostanoligenes]MCI6253603.1 UDP-N-acetylglucosamine 1-carboxyvinyltransferase [Eubacterium coprostanoligenes]MCI7264969.1 UDP-N-acetylglucosamine 1-carboxyvinyltransferase [Eubacterium coprostanoligenes]MDY5399337.1 UDP-N-acetylglucosamine 1-carboxyvinyltransferase [Eubacterium coprostanoligenes]SJZ40602.1 UDP-N-acetylglucosamine 1-carboxyvinyltransferase [Eubacterium coprostanoligenes]
MDNFVINGGHELFGEVNISGAKNAAVAIIPAALLAEDTVRIENIPQISDVHLIIEILNRMGAEIKVVNKNTLDINTTNINYQSIPYELTSHFRASYYLIGAMLGRFSKADVALPGGCDFGVRPIDQHVKGFKMLGAQVDIIDGVVCAKAEKLVGTPIYMDVVSVGATINIMLAAVKARGLTVIENAAKEPHIVDLANFLNSMGADVRGAGTDVIKIRGVEKMHGCTYSIIPDQIEAGTYMVAAAACGGDVLVKNVIPKHLESITAKLEEAGAEVIEYDDAVRVTRFKALSKCNVKTMPHPGFPTDMQPQMAVLLSIANGTSILSESVWDNRFQYVQQLLRMGADIQVDGKVAVIVGVPRLDGTTVRATDLRAGAAMIIAGLVAEGVTTVEDTIYVERGYEDVVEKFSALGADIKRVAVKEENTVSSAG